MTPVVPLAQLTTAFPSITQAHAVYCPGLSRLHLLCSQSGNQALYHSLRISSGAPISTSLSVWMDSSVRSPSEEMSDFLFR